MIASAFKTKQIHDFVDDSAEKPNLLIVFVNYKEFVYLAPMSDVTFKTLGDLWQSRKSERVGVMNLKEKSTYLILNRDERGYETYSARHGILYIKASEAEHSEWMEWPAAEAELLKH